MVKVDDVLSQLLGVPKDELVSYTELTKGLHEYIKNHGLKQRPESEPAVAAPPVGAVPQ